MLAVSPPVSAHTAFEVAQWHITWADRVQDAGWLTLPLMADRREFNLRHTTRRAARTGASLVGVEQWRTLVAEHFPPGEVDNALVVMACESGGAAWAKNPSSSASGLFQILRLWWGGSIDPFDPAANVKLAAHIWQQGNRRAGAGPNWGHWICQPDGTRWTF